MLDTSSKKRLRDDGSSNSGVGASEFRLWPPPALQAYCLDHFMMECNIYYEQENERYSELVNYSRETFLQKQGHRKSISQATSASTRIQPSRKAKAKHSLEGTKLPTAPRGAPGPTVSSNVPFKPPKLERAFKKSPQGAVFRNLTELRKKLGLQKSWEEYRVALEGRIKGPTSRLLVEIEKNHTQNCVFHTPLAIECRYCDFVDKVQDDEAVTPRKLAPPAQMHAVKCLSGGDGAKESKLTFRGIEFIVDICGEKTMIVLMGMKGLLDLCAEIFEEEEAAPGSPTSLFARFDSMNPVPRVIKSDGTERRADESISDRERGREKSEHRSTVQEDTRTLGVDQRPCMN
ncbi:hypothetical protein GGR55DRAFT_688435 [Xylaria sp. FL0064]|nr:hypothetical protein GGR55DRAFT_688435 [Xylaria sp. FL0064]